MIVAQPRSLPTTFAIKVATKCNLYVPPEEETGNEELWMDLRNRLADFQKLSLTTEFDKALISYWGVELSERQVALLQIVYDTTKDWLMGHVVGELLEQMESRNKFNTMQAAQLLLENFANPKGPTEQAKRGLLVRFARIDE